MSAISYPSHQGRLLLFGQGDLVAGYQTHYKPAYDKKEMCCTERGSLLSPGPWDTPLAPLRVDLCVFPLCLSQPYYSDTSSIPGTSRD